MLKVSDRRALGWRIIWLVGVILLGTGVGAAGLAVEAANSPARYDPSDHSKVNDTPPFTAVITKYVYLPLISKPEDICRPTGETYGYLSVVGPPTDRPAEFHADLNLALRGYVPATDTLGLVDINGPTDPGAPQLAGLFAVSRLPTFTAVYQVNNWNWDCNCRGAPIDDPAVTLSDLGATAGETIHVPDRSEGDIGNGYKVLMLYASEDRITLKYTPEDTIASGYGLHLENVCVDENLLALYRQLNSAGRHELPALRGGQALGRARSDHVGVAVRESGAFMDPRSRKDWWHGY